MINSDIISRYQSTTPGTVFLMTNFKIFEEGDILVVKTSSTGVDTNLTLSTDYTVLLSGDNTTVTLTSALTSGEKLTVIRNLPLTQPTDYVENGLFDPEVHEKSLDRLTLIQQQLKEQISRAPSLSVSNSLSNFSLPSPEALKYLQWNSAGTGLQNSLSNTGLINVSEDPTPTLGGNLDLDGNSIVDTTITLTPTSSIELEGNTNVTGNLSVSGEFTVTGSLSLQADLDIGTYSIISSSNGDIAIAPNGTGSVVLDGLSWPQSDGSSNQIIKTDGSGQLSFVDLPGTLTNTGAYEHLYTYSKKAFREFDDFTGVIEDTATLNRHPFSWDLDSTANTSFSQTPLTSTEIGVLSFSVDAASGSPSIGITTGNDILALGGGEAIIEWRVHVKDLLSSTVDEGIYYLGLSNLNNASGTPTDGVYFMYSHASANWRAVTIDSSTDTDTDTSTAVSDSDYVKLRIVVNAAASSVGFYIDDNLVATNTTNIPSANLAPIAVFQRKNINGSNTLEADVDWFYLKWELSSTR